MPGPGSQVGGAELGGELARQASHLLQMADQIVLNPKVIVGMSMSH
jgi:hypothetical protein